MVTLADEATPSVAHQGRYLFTGGTTAITDFDDGRPGQTITIVANHTITIADGTNIKLDGSVSWEMQSGDTLTLIQKSDTYWYEISRSHNASVAINSPQRILCYEGDSLTYENEILTY